MSKDPLYEQLREKNWRRRLTSAEEEQLRAWLAAHPETLGDWESEIGLTEVLGRLPDAPVPSNFTARVLQAVQREDTAEARQVSFGWRLWPWRVRWLPRAAVATTILAAGLFTHHMVVDSQRKERAASLRDVVEAATVPGPEILQDFDAIQAMSHPPQADLALLRALE